MCPINDALQTLETHLRLPPNDVPQLGGNGVVIVIDFLRNANVPGSHPHRKCLIGLAELKEIPIQTHFGYAGFSNNNINIVDIVAIIKCSVVPGSWIIFEDQLFVQEYCKLLADTYPVVVRRSDLEQHNTDEQNVIMNLTQVWNHALHSLMSHL